jgi:hypothetical protein
MVAALDLMAMTNGWRAGFMKFYTKTVKCLEGVYETIFVTNVATAPSFDI